MKIRKISIFALALGLGLVSCSKSFEEINTNTNAPTNVEPSLLFRNVLHKAALNSADHGWNRGNVIAQLSTQFDFNNIIDRYGFDSNSELWSSIYLLLKDNEEILQKSLNNPSYEAYQGPARIMKAYLISLATDVWGDVPYSEAFRGEAGSQTPKYDTQEAIYTGKDGILENLKIAAETIKNYKGFSQLEGDIIYGNNLDSWGKLANSLRLRYLLRVSAKYPAAATEIAAIVTEGNLITTNSENAKLPFLNISPNEFFASTQRSGDFDLFRMSKTTETYYSTTNDPRIPTLFQVNSTDTYTGWESGKGNVDWDGNAVSKLGTRFRTSPDKADALIMTASEVKFIMAEAALMLGSSGDAASLYQEGINLNMEYWGVSADATFLTDADVALSGSNEEKLEKIITQKWMASFMNGYESWFEFRRTGFPKLTPAISNSNEDKIPVRFLLSCLRTIAKCSQLQQGCCNNGVRKH